MFSLGKHGGGWICTIIGIENYTTYTMKSMEKALISELADNLITIMHIM